MLKPKPYRVISGVGAGAGATLAMLLAMAGLRLAFGFPTIPELMLSSLIKLMGGQAFSDAIDRLYYAGRPLTFVVILEGVLVVGVLLGLLYAWLARPNGEGRRFLLFNTPLGGIAYGLFIGVLLNTVFLLLIEQPAFASQPYGPVFSASVVPLWLGLMLLALLYGTTLHALLIKVPAQPVLPRDEIGPEEASAERRQLLRIAGGALLALVGGGVFTFAGTILNQGGLQSPVDRTAAGGRGRVPSGRAASTPTSRPLPTNTPEPPPTHTPEPAPTDTPEPPTPELATPTTEVATSTPEPPPTSTPEPSPTPEPTATPEPPPTSTPQIGGHKEVPIEVNEITPTESFYHISKNFFDPTPSADTWKLAVNGLVDNPYELTYEELTAMPAIEVVTGMMCISNPIGGGLIGSTTWKGVRMADLLARAKPRANAVDVVMSAEDGYVDSITLKKALDPDVMVVWEMGNPPERLNYKHGFPARVLVPGIYGMKHVKWLNQIYLHDQDYKGFWQQESQGWSDPAPVNTMSRIDFPAEGVLAAGKAHIISGIAFAGDRSISKVEVSTDGGKTWQEAYAKPPLSHTAWRIWGFEWKPPKPGAYKVVVRATDGDGKLQTSKRTDPYPNGATGYHTVTYRAR